MAFKDQAITLIQELLAREISVRVFCGRYEHLWNFELETTALTKQEAVLFENLFTTAAWFSDVPEDLAANRRFKTEQEIRESARSTLQSLGVQA